MTVYAFAIAGHGLLILHWEEAASAQFFPVTLQLRGSETKVG